MSGVLDYFGQRSWSVAVLALGAASVWAVDVVLFVNVGWL